MGLLSCQCRNVVISVNELPKAFTPTEYANRSNLLPQVDAGDEAFPFLGSNETMAPVKLALGGVKVVYPDLQLKRDIGTSVLYKCAICSTYTHATDPSQQEDRSIVINLGLEVSVRAFPHPAHNLLSLVTAGSDEVAPVRELLAGFRSDRR